MSSTAASRRIRLLDPLLANQIAAGEVVERPASVVKELLENSLDAGARRIEVELEQGGIALIRVRDDGAGIAAEDLPLALARHATSKVYTREDLLGVRSLGFRGEALASIASVSRLTLISATEEQAHGWQIGPDGVAVPASHGRGTTLEVRDLFYNTPARRKFLRAERTEYEHALDVIRRIALSRGDVNLSLRHQGRQTLHVPAAPVQQERRLAAVCGQSFLREAIFLDYSIEGLRLWGWLGRPEAARAQASLQYFYLNGRITRDRLITHALRQAYGDTLYPGRHPAYVLYAEMDPAAVDVNVHPTKHEVRFREARLVHDFLVRVLREALGGDTAPVLVPSAMAPVVAEAAAGYEHAATPGEAAVPAVGRILGLLHQRYLLVEEAAGLRLVDLHRLLCGRALRAMHASLAASGELHAQPLLYPAAVTLPAELSDWIMRETTLLRRYGFQVDCLGPGQVVVRQLPAMAGRADPRNLLHVVVAHMAQGGDEAGVLQALAEAIAMTSPPPEREAWPGLLTQVGAGDSLYLSLAQLTAWPAGGPHGI